MDDPAFDFLDFDIFGGEAALISDHDETPAVNPPDIEPTETYLLRSHAYWQQIPIPPELSLAGTNILATIDDEILLGMSPSLIAHVQRVEASNGMQVISPRSVTLGGIAARTAHRARTTDMFIVGSAASRNLEWPTLYEPVPEHLFWREPIDSYPTEPSPRPKTVSSGILSSRRLLHDPISKAFLTGRALVDLQRRADVNGSADALSQLLARCWDIDADAYEDLAEASLAPVGPLLRYAIRSDDVYPTVNAPVQARKCMSVGANTAGRHLYGENSAIDWRRLRVLAESIFYQTSRLEGWTLAEMVSSQLPGNPRAAPDRPGILQMRPLPGSVWSFDSSSFRIEVDADVTQVPGVTVPQRVRDSVERFHSEARPVATAERDGASVSFVPTYDRKHVSESGEGIITGFRTLISSRTAFSAKGKTSSSAVRGFIYDCLAESTSLKGIRALWLARYMHETTEALNLTHHLDTRATRNVASRMSELVEDMRTKLGVEAGRRGATLEEWWDDMAAQLPGDLASLAEGSASWAIATAHLIMHPPTPRWAALVRAMAWASHSALARGHLSDVRLPATIGSPDRVFQAGSAVVRQLGASYGAYYSAMHDVASILAARQRRAGNKAGAEKMTLAGMMWDIRAKVAATVSLHLEDGTSSEAGRIPGKHGAYHLTTAPYPAYHRWYQLLNQSMLVSRVTKARFPHHSPAKISSCYLGVTQPLFNVPVGQNARVFRYATNPSRLTADIEKTLSQIRDDAESVIRFYEDEATSYAPEATAEVPSSTAIMPLNLDLSRFRPPEKGYWNVLTDLTNIEAEAVVDAVTRMDRAVAEEIESAEYESTHALLAAVFSHDEAEKTARNAARDAIM